MGTPHFIVNSTDPDLGAGGSVPYSFQPPPSSLPSTAQRHRHSDPELDYETTGLPAHCQRHGESLCQNVQRGVSLLPPEKAQMSASFPAKQGL